ncbi:hypothetical protein CTAYLR_000184 [Chrysophaeum taylorii]|uniref:Glutathione S-transferase n=1 Tax=Chrysophaeum taylorii TaxID=2483200 RepID=A0AAD7UEE2_9STRA|nr:hypothetical protein CTAYLR_000184 [Chrysophaeum taylorii]
MLEELNEVAGVEFEHIPARPWSEEAKKHNPFGKVPALSDGEFVMYESAAINTYLGDKFGLLVPKAGTKERGKYEQVVHTIQCELDAQGVWVHRKHEQLADSFGAAPEAVKAARKHAAKVIKVLADECNPYLLGNEFTAADVLFVHCLVWARMIGWSEDTFDSPNGCAETTSHLKTYLELCQSRPAFERTQARE